MVLYTFIALGAENNGDARGLLGLLGKEIKKICLSFVAKDVRNAF
jgi:hypothetical protein